MMRRGRNRPRRGCQEYGLFYTVTTRFRQQLARSQRLSPKIEKIGIVLKVISNGVIKLDRTIGIIRRTDSILLGVLTNGVVIAVKKFGWN